LKLLTKIGVEEFLIGLAESVKQDFKRWNEFEKSPRFASHSAEGAQIINTCTADKRNATILRDEMIGSGVHINAIGGDCPGKTELDKNLLLRSDVFIEFEPQSRIEGEIQQLAPNSAVTEFHEVINGHKNGRTSAQQLTIFDGVGFALVDFSALRYLKNMIQEHSEHQMLDLLAKPSDPRNLFGLLTEVNNHTLSKVS
jgi:ornithine cyclodeaminase